MGPIFCPESRCVVPIGGLRETMKPCAAARERFCYLERGRFPDGAIFSGVPISGVSRRAHTCAGFNACWATLPIVLPLLQ